MAYSPKPAEPLRILTIDGGGLQAISSLLILGKLIKTFAQSSGTSNSSLRPCDVFDVIAGIGAGGWLALLLGRFQLDVSSALAEWIHLIDCIRPETIGRALRLRWMEHSYYDPNRVTEQVNQLIDFYEIDPHMFFQSPDQARCKHVFVSGLEIGSKDQSPQYHLFRTYNCPKGARVLPEPSEPNMCKISDAFGATGAAKYFTPPWKDNSVENSKLKFFDTNSPNAHNITELALDEMWGLYGTDVEISVIINIGPGSINAADFNDISRIYFWGRKKKTLPATGQSHNTSGVGTITQNTQPDDHELANAYAQDSSQISQRTHFDPGDSVDGRNKTAPYNTIGSGQNINIEDKLKMDQSEIVDHIRKKLRTVYPRDTPPYYRLAPEMSAKGTAQNDTSSPGLVIDHTDQYLRSMHVECAMQEICQRMLQDVSRTSG